MRSTTNPKTLLGLELDEQALKVLSRARYALVEGRRQPLEQQYLLAVIRHRLRERERSLTSPEEKIHLEGYYQSIINLELEFSCRSALRLLSSIVGSDSTSPTEEPIRRGRIISHGPLPKAFQGMSLIFERFRQYEGGPFHAVKDRVLFEYFLTLHYRHCGVRDGHEFFHSQANITKATGVPAASIRAFMHKADKLDVIRCERKGVPAQNYYRLNLKRLKELTEEILPSYSESKNKYFRRQRQAPPTPNTGASTAE